jgi:hypothetical protein
MPRACPRRLGRHAACQALRSQIPRPPERRSRQGAALGRAACARPAGAGLRFPPPAGPPSAGILAERFGCTAAVLRWSPAPFAPNALPPPLSGLRPSSRQTLAVRHPGPLDVREDVPRPLEPPSGGSGCSESESGRALRRRQQTSRRPRSQTGAETASGLRTGLLCALAVAFPSLAGLGRAPSKHRKGIEVQIIDPATRQAPFMESGSLPDCFSALPDQRRPRRFPNAVSLRRPFASACPPCRSTLMRALTPAALPFACASARPLRSVGCRRRRRRRHPRRTAIAASDALAQPQEGHAQANAAGVRRSPVVTADGVAVFGSRSPGIPPGQPLLYRHRTNVVPKVAPKRPPVNSPQVSAEDVGNSRPIAFLGGPEPPARLFCLRRRAGPLRPRLRWGRRSRASVEGL